MLLTIPVRVRLPYLRVDVGTKRSYLSLRLAMLTFRVSEILITRHIVDHENLDWNAGVKAELDDHRAHSRTVTCPECGASADSILDAIA